RGRTTSWLRVRSHRQFINRESLQVSPQGIHDAAITRRHLETHHGRSAWTGVIMSATNISRGGHRGPHPGILEIVYIDCTSIRTCIATSAGDGTRVMSDNVANAKSVSIVKSLLHNFGVVVVGFAVAFLGAGLELLLGFHGFKSFLATTAGWALLRR